MYTKADIRDLVEYGRIRGVRVLPEFDAPAHVGEGWQDTGLTVCFKVSWGFTCFINNLYHEEATDGILNFFKIPELRYRKY